MPAFAAAALAAPASESVSVGERAYQKCYSCHSLDPDGQPLQGPNLSGIVGRRIAAEPGFDYSPALEQFARTHPRWTRELLDRMIADPEALVPGTSMAFHGISDPGERQALIQFIESRSLNTP